MDGWRISKLRYADPPAAAFDGEGSRRRGGRWTPPGTRVAYASSSLALATLEYFVSGPRRHAFRPGVDSRIDSRWREMRTGEYRVPSSIVARGPISAGTLVGLGEVAVVGLVGLPLGALGSGPGRVQLADQ